MEQLNGTLSPMERWSQLILSASIKGDVMAVRWSKLMVEVGMWLCTEAVLTAVGLDDLANYSEFMLQHQSTFQSLSSSISLVIS
jgi:hypothetical protein